MTPLAWSWRDLALCRQVVTADYDPFFSDDPEDQDDALALCAVCPAQGACLAYAVRTAQPHGIWGGRPQAELQRLIARDRAGRPRRALIAAPEHHNAAKTRCRRGHPFDAANTYYDAAGKRRCRACLRAAWHRWKAERRQPAPRTPEGVAWMPEPFVLSPGTAVAGPPRPRIRRRSRQQGRAQRWDTRPVLTSRDAATLRFIGEQYAVRDDVLAVLLGRLSPAKPRESGMLGPRTLRQRLGRWQEAGWVERRRLLGHTWVLPTRTGLRLAGLDFDVWEPAESRLAHHHAAAVIRLARERVPGRGGWVCERELWRRRGKASWHLADGALPAPVPAGWQEIDQAWELVEVELHQKARPRLMAAVKTRPPHTAAITYYVPAALHAPLSAQLASVVRELGGRPPVAVEPLPQVPGVTYMTGGDA